MRRRISGVGAELASLVLILACLAGSFGSIVAVYRRVNGARTRAAQPPVVAVAPAPIPAPVPVPVPPKSVPAPAPIVAVPPPVDPTPRVLADLTAAEAEQLLEASRANRKAQALEEARQAAVAESERWRRRQSLIHSQINTLESKVRKVEINLDAMALERDALEKELDARKAAVTRAGSRPGQAILPHKGPNGTWRRPIVVECRNGAAVIQPAGLEFGLLDLESGFGPSSNRFVAAVAREAVRVERQASPDGAPVVPYIFFVVRPDGIRPYYEARGRLEALGITFGYELADLDWEIEFPDLDDVVTWDGSAPRTGATPVVSGHQPRAVTNPEDTDLATWPAPPRPTGIGPAGTNPTEPFTFGNPRPVGGAGSPWAAVMGRPLGATPPGAVDRPGADGAAPKAPDASPPGQPATADPGSKFVWPAGRDRDGKRRSAKQPTDSPLAFPASTAERADGPTGSGMVDRPNPGASGGDQAARRMLGPVRPGGSPSIPPPGSPPPVPETLGIGLTAPASPAPLISPIPRPPTPGEVAAAVQRQLNPGASAPDLADLASAGAIVDRTFEVVIVCDSRGVIVQPGTYRITTDALKDRDGLFKRQVVAVVKARRAMDPATEIKPRIRFLVQPRGFETYQAARSQFFVSGLNWPTVTEVASPDPLAISTSGVR